MALRGLSWPRVLRYGSAGRLLLLSLSLLFTPVRSGLVNFTIDDTFGDPNTGLRPQYTNGQDDSWNAGSSAEDCPDCHINQKNLDLSQIYKGTWHDTTFLPGETPVAITVQFTGTAVYVYNILPNTVPGTNTNADISFSIDGENVGRFTRSPDSSSTVLYNQLVFSSTGLANGAHTIVMTPNANSLILFDYLVYTAEVEDPSTSSSATPPPPTPFSSPSTSTRASSTSSAQSSSESSGPSVASTSTSTTSTQSSSTSSGTLSSASVSQGTSSSSASATSTNPPTGDSPAQSPSSSTPASETTSPDSSSSKPPSSRTPIAAIVGAVVGGIVLLLGAVLGILILCRRCRKPPSSRAARTHLGAADGDGDGETYAGGYSDRDRDSPGDGASFVPSMVSATSISPLRMTAHRDSHPTIASPTSISYYSNSNSTFVSSRPDSTHPTLRLDIPASPSTMAMAAGRPPKLPSRAELAWRLEELQHTRSALSTPVPNPASGSGSGSGSRSGTGSGSNGNINGERGTETAIRDLEAEIADLRAALNAMNARLEDEHQHRGDAEFLPAYAE